MEYRKIKVPCNASVVTWVKGNSVYLADGYEKHTWKRRVCNRQRTIDVVDVRGRLKDVTGVEPVQYNIAATGERWLNYKTRLYTCGSEEESAASLLGDKYVIISINK